MNNTTKITKQNINKQSFLKAMDELGILLNGRRRELAELSGLEYNTYKHYMYGYGNDTDLAKENYWKIYTAALQLAADQKDKFLTSLSHLTQLENQII